MIRGKVSEGKDKIHGWLPIFLAQITMSDYGRWGWTGTGKQLTAKHSGFKWAVASLTEGLVGSADILPPTDVLLALLIINISASEKSFWLLTISLELFRPQGIRSWRVGCNDLVWFYFQNTTEASLSDKNKKMILTKHHTDLVMTGN